MEYFLVYFTDDAPLARYAIETQEVQELGQETARALLCTSVIGTSLGTIRLVPKERKLGREVAFHVPPAWVAAIAEAESESQFGFRAVL